MRAGLRREGRAGCRRDTGCAAMADLGRARAAKARLRTDLAGRDGVCGVGISRSADGYHVQVNLERDADRPDLPRQVDGVPVDVRVSGPIRAGG